MQDSYGTLVRLLCYSCTSFIKSLIRSLLKSLIKRPTKGYSADHAEDLPQDLLHLGQDELAPLCHSPSGSSVATCQQKEDLQKVFRAK